MSHNRMHSTADSGVIVSINPSTGEELGRTRAMDRNAVDRVLSESRTAFAKWAETPFSERKRLFKRLSRVILAEKEEILRLVAREAGKPVTEAMAVEVLSTLAAIKTLTRKGHSVLRPRRVSHDLILFSHKRSTCRFVPYGVTVFISPWNFPFSAPIPQMAAALLAGNTAVFKPAPHAVLIGRKIDDCFRRAGFPQGVMQTVFLTDDDAPYLTSHPDVRKIVFTGSTEVGKHVMTSAAQHVTRVTLELGGKDPAVVARDADIRRAAKGIVWGALFGSGQVCASIERVYVESPVAQAFLEACLDEISKIRVGDPLDIETDMGPLTSESQLRKVEEHVKDAVAKGAKILFGGKRIGERGFFYEPTLLSGVDHTMKVMTEETFGPVIPVMEVPDLDAAVRLANDSRYGLSAFGWTRNRSTARRLLRELCAGTVMINDSTSTWGEPNAPWVGFKESGLGLTRSLFGMAEMVQVQYTSYDRGNNTHNPWWFPYTARTWDLFASASSLLYDPRFFRKIPSLFRLLKNPLFLRTAHWGAVLKSFHKVF